MFTQFDLILAAGLGWAVYGFLNLLLSKERQDSNGILSLLVLGIFLFPILDHLIKPLPEPGLLKRAILLIARNIHFLTGPALYFYVGSLVRPKALLFRRIPLHVAPFVLWVLLNLLFPHGLPLLPEHGPLPGNPVHPGASPSLLGMIRDLSSSLLPLVYVCVSFLEVHAYGKRIFLYYSRDDGRTKLLWLKILLGAMIVTASLALLFSLFRLLGWHWIPRKFPFPVSPYLRSASALLFMFYFSFFSRQQSIPEDTQKNFQPGKYQKSSLEDDKIDFIYTKLLQTMEKEKPFLDPELTLDGLACRMNVSKHHLSQTINRRGAGNFYGMVNAYRMEEFQRMLESESSLKYSLIGLAFECGFRSSSSFYSLVKRTKGMTPKEFARSIASKRA